MYESMLFLCDEVEEPPVIREVPRLRSAHYL
jgi:hypothetical protein